MKYWKTEDFVYQGDPFGEYEEITEEEFKAGMIIQQRKQELTSLKAYLADTDYIYPKCIELGLNVDTVYADVVTQRKTARERIQLLEGN